MNTDRIAIYVQMEVNRSRYVPEGVILCVNGDQMQCEYDSRGDELFQWDVPLLGIPNQRGVWIWEGRVSSSGLGTGEWRRPTTPELIDLSLGNLWKE